VEACLNLPKERYAMMRNSTVVRLRQPEAIDDPLTAVLRSGARRLLAQAIEAEAEAFLSSSAIPLDLHVAALEQPFDGMDHPSGNRD
jgi:hypothetical protein